MKKNVKLLILSSVLCLGLGGFLIGFLALRYTQTPAGTETSPVIFEVRPSKSFKAVSEELYRLGVINNPKLFYLYARVKGERGQLRVGEYELNSSMVPGEVLAVITSGKSRARPFLVPEGHNIFEIAALYEIQGFGRREDFLALAQDRPFVKLLLGQEFESLEGYLFPETYQITKFTTVKELLTSMVRRFQSTFAEVTAVHSKKSFTTHQAVTLASIIEKETGAPSERRTISSVFHNRLSKRMRLQTDPTVIYGMTLASGAIPTNIRKNDLLNPTPYNTYVISGLPPGPISNPGKEALMAALNPDGSEFLYFVSQNNGTHIFTKTYQDHLNAVKRYQMDPKARQGKSWRDLPRSPGTDPDSGR